MYRISAFHRQNEAITRTEYESKCEARRFFSVCVHNERYSHVEWDKIRDTGEISRIAHSQYEPQVH